MKIFINIDKRKTICIIHSIMRFFSFTLILLLLFYNNIECVQFLFPQDTNSNAQFVTISAVGDIMMGSDFPDPILPPSSGKHLFDNVKEHFNTNIVFGNLEGPFCIGGYTNKNIESGRTYAFRTPPEYAKNLTKAGFNCISLANNHIMDFGIKGIRTTLNILDSLKIQHSGQIGDIARFNINGLKVGLIAFSTYNNTYNILDENKAYSTIRSLSDSFDIFIVSMHAGAEGIKALHTINRFEYFYGEARGNVVRFAHKAIENGADLILGHGPHIPRAMEIYKDRLIAYSLGNFCPYGRFSLRGVASKSFILKVKLNKDGSFNSGNIVPIDIKKPGIPYIDTTIYTIKLIQKLSKEDFNGNQLRIDSNGNIFQNKSGI
ncbi:CapA family protein [candidate division WOR-3 bacterium]|nr:CapA family protein [candidate division WOR-3 bacterium]